MTLCYFIHILLVIFSTTDITVFLSVAPHVLPHARESVMRSHHHELAGGPTTSSVTSSAMATWMGSYQRINQGAYGSERQACNHDKACLWRVWNSDRVIISRVATGLSVTRDVVRRLGC